MRFILLKFLVKIAIHFARLSKSSIQLQAEKSANCPNDYVQLINGPYGSTDVIVKLCGNALPLQDSARKFRSKSNFLLLHMHTNGDGSHRGFIARHSGMSLQS